MTFKEYLKKKLKKKKKQDTALPQAQGSVHNDTSNMTSPTVLPASGECPQPSL
jgi:hypothetical protein